MLQDSVLYDSVKSRPLPEWLVKQQQGATTSQPEKKTVAEDHSLNISVAVSVIILIIGVVSATLILKRKFRKM